MVCKDVDAIENTFFHAKQNAAGGVNERAEISWAAHKVGCAIANADFLLVAPFFGNFFGRAKKLQQYKSGE